MPNGRCRLHGGLTPRGIANPNFKTGRYSKYLGDRAMAQAYEDAQNDPELLNISDEIMVVRARLEDIVRGLETQDASTRWKEAQTALKKYEEAAARQDEYGWRTALSELRSLIRDGNQEWRVWDDFLRTVKIYSDLIAKEQKRRMDMNALVSVDQAVGFAAELMVAVKEEVTDTDTLRAIHLRISNALQRRPSFAMAFRDGIQRAAETKL